MQKVDITQKFNAPQQDIFDYLSNHNNLTSIFKINVKRIKDAIGNNINGVGSVRSLGIGFPFLEETVTIFNEPNLIEYKISNNVPINYHLGRLEFSTIDHQTVLHYTIDLESKFAFVDPLFKIILENSIKNGLKKLASKYK